MFFYCKLGSEIGLIAIQDGFEVILNISADDPNVDGPEPSWVLLDIKIDARSFEEHREAGIFNDGMMEKILIAEMILKKFDKPVTILEGCNVSFALRKRDDHWRYALYLPGCPFLMQSRARLFL